MAGRAQTVLVDGRKLRLTNADKVLYPATGTTKAEVLNYLLQAAELMLPHMAGRLCTRKRWPDGVGTPSALGEVFFEKNLPDHAPEWIRRVRVEHNHRAPYYPVIESVADLAWFGQMNALELHVHQWRVAADGSALNPDRLVLDLDPGPGVGLAECVAVAHDARDLLSEIGLQAVPVTSGSKGLHLYCPLDGDHDGTYVNAFAKQIAQGLESQLPNLVVSSMTKSVRRGKVLVDWSQNNVNKTTIAPYSLRGTFTPMVAAPRNWDEINENLTQLDLSAVLNRLDTDPFADLAGASQPPPSVQKQTEPGAMTSTGRSRARHAHREQFRPAITAQAGPTVPRARTRAETSVMLATLATADAQLDPNEWSFEMKWDGIRALALVDDGAATLLTRNGNDVTDSYPEIAATLAGLHLGPMVLDGELVALASDGTPDFGLLQGRMGVVPTGSGTAASTVAVTYIVFDLLEHSDIDTRPLAFRQRRAALEYLNLEDHSRAAICVSNVFDGTLTEAVAASIDANLEGVVAKRLASPYRAGRSKSWLKFKNVSTTDAIVVGWSPGSRSQRGAIGSLLLAVNRDGNLHYAGRVGSGFTGTALRAAYDRLQGIERPSAPVPGVPGEIARTARWVEPRLVAEVAFSGWTRGGHLRHATWRGWRDDVPLDEVVGKKS